MMIGLGSTCVRMQSASDKCPSGYAMKSSRVCPPYSGRCYDIHECCAGESWPCEWFGIGCQGPPPPPAPPSPQTVPELSTPGEWTPEMVSSQWYEDYRRQVEEHMSNTSGIAQVPVAVGEAASKTGEFLGSRTAWLAVGIAVGVALLIAVKKV